MFFKSLSWFSFNKRYLFKKQSLLILNLYSWNSLSMFSKRLKPHFLSYVFKLHFKKLLLISSKKGFKIYKMLNFWAMCNFFKITFYIWLKWKSLNMLLKIVQNKTRDNVIYSHGKKYLSNAVRSCNFLIIIIFSKIKTFYSQVRL